MFQICEVGPDVNQKLQKLLHLVLVLISSRGSWENSSLVDWYRECCSFNVNPRQASCIYFFNVPQSKYVPELPKHNKIPLRVRAQFLILINVSANTRKNSTNTHITVWPKLTLCPQQKNVNIFKPIKTKIMLSRTISRTALFKFSFLSSLLTPFLIMSKYTISPKVKHVNQKNYNQLKNMQRTNSRWLRAPIH